MRPFLYQTVSQAYIYKSQPKYYDKILGKTFSVDVERGQPLYIHMINE